MIIGFVLSILSIPELFAFIDYGQFTRDNEFPQVVKITSFVKHPIWGPDINSTCTGTLIASDVILTAAHCASAAPGAWAHVSLAGDATALPLVKSIPQGITVKASYVAKKYQELKPQLVALESVVGGSDYIKMTHAQRESLDREIRGLKLLLARHDLGLIELEQEQEINWGHIPKIQCLTNSSLGPGAPVSFVGFGASKIPNTLNNNPQGLQQWGENRIERVLEKSLYFTARTKSPMVINSGDSGGPLFRADDTSRLFGVSVLRDWDKKGNALGGFFVKLNSPEALGFFAEVLAHPWIPAKMKRPLSHCR
jgi:hypothetical protein